MENIEEQDKGVQDSDLQDTDVQDNGAKDNDNQKTAQQDHVVEERSSNTETVDVFNNTLGDQMERLLGSRYGFDEMPLNFATIPAIILLALRETEIESFPYLPPSRYSKDSLFEELSEMNMKPPDAIIEPIIEQMVEKKYIEIADDGRFFTQKPTLTVAQIIDRVLPNMPGINLIAYLGQILDEVNSERKDLDTANTQFNQVLELQGVVIQRDGEKKGAQQTTHAKKKISSDIYNQLHAKTWTPPKPKSLTSQLDTRKIEIKTSQIERIEIEPEQPGEEISASPEAVEKIVSEAPTEAVEQPALPPEVEQPQPDEPVEEIPQEEPEVLDDEDIEKRISEFEEKLSMKCPLCQTGAIKVEQTAKGKAYYHCSSPACSFISWGKPYFITCPECKNPFLVEADRGGTTIYKCPRAACLHWQSDLVSPKTDPEPERASTTAIANPKPRRKRKKRRVVRRRKKR